MERTKELRDQLGRAHEAGEAILKEAREKGWSDELHATFDKTHDEMGEIRQTLEAITKQAEAKAIILDKHEERKYEETETAEQRGVAMTKARKRDIEERGQSKRFAKWCRGGWPALNADDMAMYAEEARALGTSPDAAGGFLVPTDMMTAITEAILAFGGIRQSRATIMRTRAGNPLAIPQNDDTANVGVILDENVAASEDDPVFTEQILGAFKYTSNVVRVSLELLDDNLIDDFEGFLGRMLGTRIGRIQNTHFTVGAGTTEPFGVVTQAAVGITAALAATVGKDDIIDLIHSLDPGYSANAEFMMNFATLGELRKLDTTEGLPIWNQVQENTPSRLYGLPIIVNQDMADVAATSVPILVGDFSLYLVRDVWPIRVTRTTELFWLESQIGLMALARADGLLNDAGTGPVVKMTMAV